MSKKKSKILIADNNPIPESFEIRDAGIEVQCCWCDHPLTILEMVDAEGTEMVIPVTVCDHCGAEFEVEDKGYETSVGDRNITTMPSDEEIAQAVKEREGCTIH